MSDDSVLNEVTLKNGEKLILRKSRSDDAEQMIEYLNIVGGESNNLLFGEGDFHLTVEQEIQYINNTNNDINMLMVVGLIGERIVSISQINSFGRKRISHNSDLSISVRKEYWRCGIGSAVMMELICFAKKSETIQNISLGVRASNTIAISMYKKFGFIQIGVHHNFFNIDGNFDDEILMDLYL